MNKLKLIEEHQKEYYDRQFYFVEEGFMTYQISRTFKMQKYIYFHDMFVSERGTVKDLMALLKYFIRKQKDEDIEIAYCRVEKKNENYEKLTRMYDTLGFQLIHETEHECYYRWEDEQTKETNS